MKGAAQFYLDVLMEEPGHHWLVTGPSISPENAFLLPGGEKAHVCLGPTVDMQQLRELFGNCIQAAGILAIDRDFQKKLRNARKRLAPNLTGPDGRLQEWLAPYEEQDPHHRHLSHLYGLFPYHEITPSGTPELAEAARRSLERRGDGGTGWSKAWKVNLWARLRDEEHAHKILRSLIGDHSFDNLFSICPPFIIDANFGGTSGMAEMLLQSHPDTGAVGAEPIIHLLPALPMAWPAGKVTGLRARGGLTVDIHWDRGQLSQAVIRSDQDGTVSVRSSNQDVVIPVKANQTYTLDRNLKVGGK
jgi:alpha-L-fucosidase 2